MIRLNAGWAGDIFSASSLRRTCSTCVIRDFSIPPLILASSTSASPKFRIDATPSRILSTT
jgi:hypothetical protein